MSAFIDLYSELTGALPGLSPMYARKLVNRALEKIYGERTWSFLQTDGVVVCPAMVTTGTVSITQYSADVTLDTDASAALLDQADGTVQPGILQLQIRFGSGASLGGIYSILACDFSTPTAIVLTLDRVVQEPTDADSEYQCYRCYVIPPITDFLRWESVVDFANAITLTGNRINMSSTMFDVSDPQRTSQGLAYYLGGWGGNRIVNAVTGATSPNATVNQSTPIYELWPHPTQGQTFYVRIRRKGETLINPTDEPPSQISDEIILAKAFQYAYRFAKANIGSFPSFKGADWTTLLSDVQREYRDELTDMKRNDDEQQLQSVYARGHGLRGPYSSQGAPWPIDANYVATHLLNF